MTWQGFVQAVCSHADRCRFPQDRHCDRISVGRKPNSTIARTRSFRQARDALPNTFGAGGEAPLHDKLLADPAYLARYLQRLRAFVDGAGSAESLTHRLDVGAAALGERITEQSVADLRRAIATRVTALAEAIDSTTSCNTAAATGGPGGVPPQ